MVPEMLFASSASPRRLSALPSSDGTKPEREFELSTRFVSRESRPNMVGTEPDKEPVKRICESVETIPSSGAKYPLRLLPAMSSSTMNSELSHWTPHQRGVLPLHGLPCSQPSVCAQPAPPAAA
eukprot:2518972-Prymnesium_polylepis.2